MATPARVKRYNVMVVPVEAEEAGLRALGGSCDWEPRCCLGFSVWFRGVDVWKKKIGESDGAAKPCLPREFAHLNRYLVGMSGDSEGEV